jgi:hypothetical protein
VRDQRVARADRVQAVQRHHHRALHRVGHHALGAHPELEPHREALDHAALDPRIASRQPEPQLVVQVLGHGRNPHDIGRGRQRERPRPVAVGMERAGREHEPGAQRALPGQAGRGPGDGDAGLQTAVLDGRDDQATGHQLLEPGRRDAADTDRRDDPVERAEPGCAAVPVGLQHGDARDAGPAERLDGVEYHVGLHVDAHDRRTGDRGDQRGVVPGAGAHLQHPVPGPQPQRLEHLGHQRGLRAGTARQPVAHPGHQGFVGVDPLRGGRDRPARQVEDGPHEMRTGHPRERLDHGGVGDAGGDVRRIPVRRILGHTATIA